MGPRKAAAPNLRSLPPELNRRTCVNGGNMHLILALAIYSFGLFTGALGVAFFEGVGRGRRSDARQTQGAHHARRQQPYRW